MQAHKEGRFCLLDMYDLLESIAELGPLNKVLDMIPGMLKMLQNTNGVDRFSEDNVIPAYHGLCDS